MRELAAIVLCAVGVGRAQTGATAQFEVATIKLSGAEGGSGGIRTTRGIMDAQNVTLKRCIMGAYGVGPNQVLGGPEWTDTVTFVIVGKSEQPSAGDETLMAMLQSLLSARFKLAVHSETRELPVFVLEVGKKGAKLETSPGGEAKTNTTTGNAGAEIDARNASMDRFADVLSRKMDRPVVNRTALEGVYNLRLRWTPERAMQTRPADGAAAEGPSMFTAIQEQLGLRLRAAKARVDVVVIDHAEMPGEN